MRKLICRVGKSTRGATAIEYGLIAALIALAAVGSMGALGTVLKTTFSNVSSSFPA